MALSLLILFCAPGIKGEINPYYTTKLDLPSLNTGQAPTVYRAGGGFSRTSVKLFGGLSSGTIRYPEIEDADLYEQYLKSLSGLAGGIGFMFGGRVGAEVDIMYVQKGAKVEGNNVDDGFGGTVNGEASIQINQISIPVLISIKFLPGTSPYILFGGSVSYILSATADYTVTFEGQTEAGTEDLFKAEDGTDPEILSRLGYSAIGGAGIALSLGSMRFTIEARYIYGLANIVHESQRATGADELGTTDDWIKLTTILFMAGISF